MVVDLHELSALQKVDVRGEVFLRPLELVDSARLLEILDTDPEIRRSVTVAARLHNEKDVQDEIASAMADDGLIRYVLIDGTQCIGLVSFWRDDGFFGVQADTDVYGFGYFIDPNYRGKGLISDAVRSLMTVATAKLVVNAFTAFCEDHNNASQAVLTKLGFVRTNETYQEPTHGWVERRYIKPIQ